MGDDLDANVQASYCLGERVQIPREVLPDREDVRVPRFRGLRREPVDVRAERSDAPRNRRRAGELRS